MMKNYEKIDEKTMEETEQVTAKRRFTKAQIEKRIAHLQAELTYYQSLLTQAVSFNLE